MRIELWCNTHKADVIPAGDVLSWLPRNQVDIGHLKQKSHLNSMANHIHASEFELGEGDLYCTGGEGDHEFVITATNQLGVMIYNNSNTDPEYISTYQGTPWPGENTTNKDLHYGPPSNKNDGDCWCCGGLNGTHTVRSCAGIKGNKTEETNEDEDTQTYQERHGGEIRNSTTWGPWGNQGRQGC